MFDFLWYILVLKSTPSRLGTLLLSWDMVELSLNPNELASVAEVFTSDVSLFRWVTGHIVVSSGLTAGTDSSGENSIDVDTLGRDGVVVENSKNLNKLMNSLSWNDYSCLG